jgi:hypothetical protein
MSYGAFRRVLAGLTGIVLALSGCRGAPEHTPIAEVVLRDVVSVGQVDGDEVELFGRIIDVRALDDGSFFVLDAQSATVNWFDSSGGYRDGIRARGAGPGELSGPAAMDVDGSRWLHVLDRHNLRLSVYELSAGRLAHLNDSGGSWLPFGSGRVLCSADNRLYLREPRNGRLIHEIDATGEVLNSFGQAAVASPEEYGPFAPIVEPQLNAGHLRCLDDPPLVLAMESYLPVVRAFTPDGDVVWESELRDLRPWRIVAAPGAGVSYERDPNGSHAGISLVRWGDDALLVQYSISPESGTPENRDYSAIESRELDLATGEERGRSLGLPAIADTRGALVYSFENHPFPRVRVLTRGK